jgi:predicted Fe-Mo cluster-binding NifX family protein
MKTAFSYWENRIAPVFDTARQIHVIKAESGIIVGETQETLPEDFPIRKVCRLVDLGIGTLVCGAISRPLHAMVSSYGIQVVPFIAGDLHEVIHAWLRGSLEHAAFALPGCYGRGGWRFRGMYVSHQEAKNHEWKRAWNGRRRWKGTRSRGQRTRTHGRFPGCWILRGLHLPTVWTDGTTPTRRAVYRAQMPEMRNRHDKAITINL